MVHTIDNTCNISGLGVFSEHMAKTIRRAVFISDELYKEIEKYAKSEKRPVTRQIEVMLDIYKATKHIQN